MLHLSLRLVNCGLRRFCLCFGLCRKLRGLISRSLSRCSPGFSRIHRKRYQIIQSPRTILDFSRGVPGIFPGLGKVFFPLSSRGRSFPRHFNRRRLKSGNSLVGGSFCRLGIGQFFFFGGPLFTQFHKLSLRTCRNCSFDFGLMLFISQISSNGFDFCLCFSKGLSRGFFCLSKSFSGSIVISPADDITTALGS